MQDVEQNGTVADEGELLWEALKPRLSLLRIEMEIIQRLRKLRGQNLQRDESEGWEMMLDHATVDEIKEEVIKHRYQTMRAEGADKQDIAETLGFTRQNLRYYTKKWDDVE